MITVKFNSHEEFIAEVAKDAGNVERGIVRVTQEVSMTKMAPLRRLTVLATAVVVQREVERQLIRLERYCGELWGDGFSEMDKKTHEQAEQTISLIERNLKQCGLEIRAGVIEER